MRMSKAALIAVAALMIGTPALAQEGQPAAPSGAPQGAAKNGSSEAGKAASKNEMKSHKKNRKTQKHMANPHKKSM